MKKIRHWICFIPVIILVSLIVPFFATGSANGSKLVIDSTFSGHAYDSIYPENYQPGDSYLSGDWWFPYLNITSKEGKISILGYQTTTGSVLPQLFHETPFSTFVTSPG